MFLFANLNFTDRPKQYMENEIVLTIPGTVNTDRRDYITFLEAIYTNVKKGKKLKLYLLGKIVNIGKKEEDLITKINSLKKGTVKFWNSYIDNQTYEEILTKTDYLIGNILVDYKENLVSETYGQSKETGVLFLMLKYKIPTLFPSNYRTHSVYESLIIHYDHNVLSTIDIIINQDFKKLNYNNKLHQNIVDKEIIELNNLLNA